MVLLSLTPGLACRYNIRDIGFVDLETEPYRLHLFAPPETPHDVRSLLQELPALALHDCNIQCELVASDTASNHPAYKHLPVPLRNTYPGAVLISPDGQALYLPLSGEPPPPGQPNTNRWASVLREVASSPTREELLAAVTRSFAAVLLIEGQTTDANRRARQAVLAGIEAIRRQMQAMPKAIAAPPQLVTLETPAFARERLLLWSLGLDPTPTAQPRAAIVYGRARWMGPLMQGDEISEGNLTGLLSLIGADCECGLDMAWTLGTRLPVTWDETRHAQVAKDLGFDPESPLVKIEVGRIARRSGLSIPSSATEPGIAPSFEPKTLVDASAPGGSRASSQAASVPRAEATPPLAEFADAAPVWARAWGFVGGLGLVVLTTAALLLWRSRRRHH